MHRYVRFVTEEARNHEFCAITNGVDGTILHDDSLVAHHQGFQRLDDTTEVGFLGLGKIMRWSQ